MSVVTLSIPMKQGFDRVAIVRKHKDLPVLRDSHR